MTSELWKALINIMRFKINKSWSNETKKKQGNKNKRNLSIDIVVYEGKQ